MTCLAMTYHTCGAREDGENSIPVGKCITAPPPRAVSTLQSGLRLGCLKTSRIHLVGDICTDERMLQATKIWPVTSALAI